MEIEIVKLKDIKPNPSNPRSIKDDKFEKLVTSIKELPDMLKLRPIVVNEDMIVLGGNMRLKACQKAGLKEVPIIKASDLSPEQQKEFIIKDNVGFGDWDWDLLANEWDTDELDHWGLELPFDTSVEDAEEDNYDIPDNVQTDIVLGDIFEIGEHKLLCGSSTETDSWDKIMGSEMCDLVVTDPPYNVNYTGRTKEKLKIQNDKKTNEEFYNFLYDFYTAMSSYTKLGGSWYVWCADIHLDKFIGAYKKASMKLAQLVIWKKNNSTFGRSDYHYIHEPCLYGWKEGASHNWYSDRKQTTILEFDKPLRNAEHPTMKPIPLLAYQITNSSKEGDLVCDGFLGSGSTMVASHQLKRKCYGIELDPVYCHVVIERMLKLDPSLSVKRNGEPYELPILENV